MKEVLLKSDIEKVLREERKYIDSAWLPGETFRAGMSEEWTRIRDKLLYGTKSDFKQRGGENNGYCK